MDQRSAILTLSLIPHIGPITLSNLQAQFDPLPTIFKLPPAKWPVATNIQTSATEFLAKFSLEQFLQQLSFLQQDYLTITDAKYPELLKQIPTPPPVLYYQGNIQLLTSKCISIVGTRKPSSYADKVINYLIPPLVKSQHTIVSGFQRGVDQMAHQATLVASGRTIAVLGTGIDVAYPSNSHKLFTQILHSDGLFISEFPPHTPPDKGNFPRRNRIVSGLSQNLIVIEAAIQSGTLVTAQHALEQGREIYAVPNSILSPTSAGCHYLIQQGAKLLSSVTEITHQAVSTPNETIPNLANLNSLQQAIYQFVVSHNPDIDACIDHFQRPLTDILIILTELELFQLIAKNSQGCYHPI